METDGPSGEKPSSLQPCRAINAISFCFVTSKFIWEAEKRRKTKGLDRVKDGGERMMPSPQRRISNLHSKMPNSAAAEEVENALGPFWRELDLPWGQNFVPFGTQKARNLKVAF
uniref:Uncharacterized protein n=1 Tax=Globodera rostochiensis TaxID=31243 RepID=A0A914GWR7_GLORO